MTMVINNKQINIRPKEAVWTLGIMTAALVLAHLVGLFMRFVVGTENHYGLINLGHEANIPTYFSALILLIVALLLTLIAVYKKKISDSYALHWAILAIGFFYLSMDEAAEIHERLARPTRYLLNDYVNEAFLYRPWTIPVTALSLIAAVFYLKFLLHLPLRLRLLSLLSGTLYIASAVGLELAAAPYQNRELVYAMFITLEETFEMVAILIFIYTLMKYIETDLGGVSFHIGGSRTKSNLHNR